MSAQPIGHAPSTAAFVRTQMARGVSAETLRRRLGIRAGDMLGMVPEAGPVMTARVAPAPPPKPPAEIAAARLSAESAAVAVERVTAAVAGVMGIERGLVFADNSRRSYLARLIVITLILETRRHLPLDAVARAAGYTGEDAIMRALDRCGEHRQYTPTFAGWYDRALERLGQP